MKIFECRGPRRHGEAGRIVTMTPLMALAVLICVGIGVDFTGQNLAEQQLRDTAGYCARVGVEAASMAARTNITAVTAAQQCLADEHLTGTVTLVRDKIRVDVTGTYTTKLLSIILIDTLPTRGSAAASGLPEF